MPLASYSSYALSLPTTILQNDHKDGRRTATEAGTATAGCCSAVSNGTRMLEQRFYHCRVSKPPLLLHVSREHTAASGPA